jgi:hypothetical protein
MSDISPSTITTDKKLDEEINQATSQAEIQALIRNAAIEQGVVRPDLYDPNVLNEIPAAEKAAPATPANSFTRAEVIGGREFTFTADTDLELANMIGQAYKVAEAVRPSETDERGSRFFKPEPTGISEETKADLLLRFQLGQLSAADYVEQSGEISAYLERKGISGGLDAVQEVVAKKYEQSWQDATGEFLKNSDWPGGQRNLKVIGLTIQNLGLTDAEDKVGALTAAYNEMKRNGTIFTETPAPAATVDPKETVDQWKKSQAATVDPKATPQEIVDQWKESQSAAGKNPDEAFSSLFSRR